MLDCCNHFHQPYVCVFLVADQLFFLLNFIEPFHSLNYCLKLMIVLLNCGSWSSSQKFSLTNISTGMVGFGEEILVHIFGVWSIRSVRVNFLVWSDMDRSSQSRRENVNQVGPRDWK